MMIHKQKRPFLQKKERERESLVELENLKLCKHLSLNNHNMMMMKMGYAIIIALVECQNHHHHQHCHRIIFISCHSPMPLIMITMYEMNTYV